MDNPTLELIKFVCKIFNFESDLQNEVRVMRRALLNLIGIREFSKIADFDNPCESFILHHVICQYCQFCRDINLSVDLLPDSTTDSQAGNHQWLFCINCGQEYDMNMVEELLIHLVQKTLMAYQLQDLHCSKCRAVKIENLRDHCKSCASSYEISGISTYLYDTAESNSKKGENFVRKAKILQNVAELHDMKCLRQLVLNL
jgi:DNA polymerase epsilon subunit 1